MGATSSLFIPDAPHLVPPNHCLICFPAHLKSDEIVLLFGDDEIYHALRETILRMWPKGIDKEHPMANHVGGFKLNGRPFSFNSSNSSRLSISLAHLMCSIIEMMMNRGWNLKATINFVRESKTDSFLFAREKNTEVEPRIAAMDLGSSDQIHLVRLPGRLGKLMEELVVQHWPPGLKTSKVYPGTEDMKLITKRFPWRSTHITDNLANCRTLLLSLIRAVHREGYLLIGSGHPQNSVEEVDTLFFAPSLQPPPNIFLFGVQKHDYLYTIDAPEMCNDVVRKGILAAWPDGIDNEETNGAMWAIKTKGYPWLTSGTNAVNSRRIIMKIFQEMRAVGWRVLGTVDTTKDLDDVSCFVMAASELRQSRYMALKMSGSYDLRLIDCPPDVVECVKSSISAVWPDGFEEKQSENGTKLRFKKKLFDCQGVFCLILSAVEARGWKLVSSADLSVKYYADRYTRMPLDVHTLFFEDSGSIQND